MTGGKGVRTLTLTGEELRMQEKLGYSSCQQHDQQCQIILSRILKIIDPEL